MARVEFKRGVELLYAKLGCAVLPVSLNSGHYWRRGQSSKRAGTVTVSYLSPITAGLPAQVAMKQAEHGIQEELHQLQSAKRT